MTKKKNQTDPIARQGDILILSGEPRRTTESDVPRENGKIVLAHGEATGHMHAIDAPPSVANLFTAKSTVDRILRAKEPIRLYHDEHAPIEFPAGDYVVRRQREYRWGRTRTVED